MLLFHDSPPGNRGSGKNIGATSKEVSSVFKRYGINGPMHPVSFDRFKRGNSMIRNVIVLIEDMAVRTGNVGRMAIGTAKVSINLEQ